MAAALLFATIQVGVAGAQTFQKGSFPLIRGGQQFLGVAAPEKVRTKILSKNPDAAELETVEDNVAILVTRGDDAATRIAVKQMTEFLVKTIIPIREEQVKMDQKLLDDLNNNISHCFPEKARKRDTRLDANMDAAAERKADYAKNASSLDECLTYAETKFLVKEANCASVRDAANTCMCHSDITKAVGPIPPCKRKAVINPAHQKCCDKYAAYRVHELKCQHIKRDMRHAQRRHSIIRADICSQYSACYDTERKKYTYALKTVEENEDRRGLRSLYKIKCFVAAFEGGKVSKAEAKACEEKKYVVDTIQYPTTPTKETCAVRRLS